MSSIYVASLADYNCGILHGVWITLDDTIELDDVSLQVDAMLKESPAVSRELCCLAEEYAIHDYEGFEGYEVREFTPLAEVVAMAAAIATHGEAFALFANDRDSANLEDSVATFIDRFCGTWTTEDDFAWTDFEGLYPEAYQQTTSCDWVRFDPTAHVRAYEMDGYEFIDTASGTAVLAPGH
jgi:antirestriction protein